MRTTSSHLVSRKTLARKKTWSRPPKSDLTIRLRIGGRDNSPAGCLSVSKSLSTKLGYPNIPPPNPKSLSYRYF